MSLKMIRFAAGNFMFGLALLLPIFAHATPAMAQEVSDTIRVHTRVVFMDALVKD